MALQDIHLDLSSNNVFGKSKYSCNSLCLYIVDSSALNFDIFFTMLSALRGLEEHKKLEAALDDIKKEMKRSNTGKENYETLKEENEQIMR